MEVIPIKTRIFRVAEDLSSFLLEYLPPLQNGDVVVVTSKIVALSQGRVVPLTPDAKKKWIEKESDRVIPSPWGLIAHHQGDWCVSAGVDESNAAGQLILLPENIFSVAHDLLTLLRQKSNQTQLAVIITDTRTRPLRWGTSGIALAYAGLQAFRDYRQALDLFGRKLKMTRSNVADSLASAAVLTMGEAAEAQPLALIRGAPVDFINLPIEHSELTMEPEGDLYRSLYLET